jgi:hypothetical protein
MDFLPSELIGLLISFLPNSDIKSLRRTCKSFSTIGETYLFRDFTFRLYPDRQRLYQLDQLSLDPTIASGLRWLKYETGVQLEYADYRYWRAQVYQAESSKFSRGITTDGISQDEYRDFHAQLDSRFTPDMGIKYELYKWHLDQQAAAMATPGVSASLSETLKRLHQASANFGIEVAMREPEITLNDLASFDSSMYALDILPSAADPRLRIMKRRENCIKHFAGFFEALSKISTATHYLCAADIPRDLFQIPGLIPPDCLQGVFGPLREFDLRISELPHSDWLSRSRDDFYHRGRSRGARAVRDVLNYAMQLYHLELKFPSHKIKEYSFEIFDRTNIAGFPRLWLSNLVFLSLAAISCSLEELKSLLQDAPRLAELRLRDCVMESGSMVNLIEHLRTQNFGGVRLDGIWKVFEDEGVWHSHDQWEYAQCNESIYEGSYAYNGMRQQIERYMVTGGKCPLPTRTVNGQEQEIWERNGDTSWHYVPTMRLF